MYICTFVNSEHDHMTCTTIGISSTTIDNLRRKSMSTEVHQKKITLDDRINQLLKENSIRRSEDIAPYLQKEQRSAF